MRIVVAMGGHLEFEVTKILYNCKTCFIQSESLELVGIDTSISPLGQIVSELSSFHYINMGVLAAILKNGHIQSLPGL